MIIGVAGKIAVGKTTFSKHLMSGLARVGLPTNLQAFGDAVKVEASSYYGFPIELCFTEEGKSQVIQNVRLGNQGVRNATVRQILQYWGTEYRRKQDPDYWVKALAGTVAVNNFYGVSTILHDVRFPNEVDFIKNSKGIIFRINPHENWHPTEADQHYSERALDDYPDWDAFFTPKFGCLESFADKIVPVITSFMVEHSL